jgi:ABC-type branched-subunit amino acid transport system permease subunit
VLQLVLAQESEQPERLLEQPLELQPGRGPLLLELLQVLVRRLERSWIGLNFDALRLDETAASCFGLNIVRWKITSFLLGNFLIGIAGALFGMVGASVVAVGLYNASFWLMCLGGLILGYAVASLQMYRFAAVELAPPAYRAKAISWVMAGGLVSVVVDMAERFRCGCPPPGCPR